MHSQNELWPRYIYAYMFAPILLCMFLFLYMEISFRELLTPDLPNVTDVTDTN